MSDDHEQLRALEWKRCAAISGGRIDDLKAMLAADYTHIHMTGKIDRLDGHLEAVRARPRITERGEIDIRIHDGFAIIIGEQTNIMAQADGSSRRVTAICQQIVVRCGKTWQFISCQLTPKQ